VAPTFTTRSSSVVQIACPSKPAKNAICMPVNVMYGKCEVQKKVGMFLSPCLQIVEGGAKFLEAVKVRIG
jgi:hypothetical protein